MTQTGHETEGSKEHLYLPEDEIELFDLLHIAWKWKYLIIIGTAVCALAAVIISINMQPIYQVSMVLKSGINTVDFDGEPVYLDSVEDFKASIEGELLFKVIERSKNSRGVLSSEAFKIVADNKTNTLRILYESTDKEEGIENLNFLSHMLIERYKRRLKQLQDEYEHELLITKRQIELSIDEENFITSKLIDIQKRLDNYAEDTRPLNDSSETKAKSHNTLLDYASIVEKISNIKRRHSHVSSQIAFYKKEIADMEKEMLSKHAVIVAQPPTGSQHPIKPKKMRNVILAALIGILAMVFLALFLNYISKHSKQKGFDSKI